MSGKILQNARQYISALLLASHAFFCVHVTAISTITAGAAVAIYVPKAQAAATGSIVFDPTNLAESIKQTAEWAVQHTNSLRSYMTQLTQLKAALDQILALKDMAVKDLMASMGISDIMSSISSVQSAISDVRNFGSSVSQLRNSFESFLPSWTAASFKYDLYQKMHQTNSQTASLNAKKEWERRASLLEETARNLQKVQNSSRLLGAKSQQSSLDNLNAQTQMVASGIHNLLGEMVQDNLAKTAREQMNADKQTGTAKQEAYANALAQWRINMTGSNLVR